MTAIPARIGRNCGAFAPYFLLFGLLVAEHYTKIDRASNRAQLWRVCAVFFSALLAYAVQARVAHK
jgi:hypothetical protein